MFVDLYTSAIIISLICHTHDERIEYTILSLESVRDIVQDMLLRRKRAERFRRLSTRPTGDVANEKHADRIASVDKVDKFLLNYYLSIIIVS